MAVQKYVLPAEGVLFTDFYQLTMAQLYFRMGLHEQKVQFDYFFRSYPDYGGHKAGYCIFAGLEWVMAWMREAVFDNRSIELLKSHRDTSGKRIFADDFLGWVRGKKISDDITMLAMAEGRVVHPHEPIVTVQGNLALSQILETLLLNTLNYQTLVATKAARIKDAGENQPLIEFGMRRAHHTGADSGARAALIGGADFTSNTGISYELGLIPKGTHAHSMVQLFMTLGEGELGAFRAYADTYPDNCLLLVDTINTLESGVPNAIKVFEELRAKGHKPLGIRLDSGDLAHLSIRSAAMLDKAGFSDTSIVLSNNIDEMVLLQVLKQIRDESQTYGVDPERLIKRLVYGVGTRLITSAGHSALDGVYKLTGVYNDGTWRPTLKISETPDKTLNPGRKQVWRLYDGNAKATADLICLQEEDIETANPIVLHHPIDPDIQRTLKQSQLEKREPLLVEVCKNGRELAEPPPLQVLRKNRTSDLDALDPGVKRLINPHIYHVSLSDSLWNLKHELIREQNQF